jgi:hypothetical protein
LGAAGRGLRIDRGVEVGGVVKEDVEVEVVALGQPEAEGLLDASERVGVPVIEVVPEAWAGEVLGGDGEEARPDGALVPLGQSRLWAGAEGSVEGGEQQLVRQFAIE